VAFRNEGLCWLRHDKPKHIGQQAEIGNDS